MFFMAVFLCEWRYKGVVNNINIQVAHAINKNNL